MKYPIESWRNEGEIKAQSGPVVGEVDSATGEHVWFIDLEALPPSERYLLIDPHFVALRLEALRQHELNEHFEPLRERK